MFYYCISYEKFLSLSVFSLKSTILSLAPFFISILIVNPFYNESIKYFSVKRGCVYEKITY
jgi:hypothetical protein